MANKNFLFSAIGVLCLGIFLRLYNLLIIPIFVDEAIYVRWSQVMRSDATLRFLPLSDGKQPLFMWITIPFLKIFEDPLIAARLVSVICGVGSMIGIFLLSWQLFKNSRIALVSALIYAISPFTVFFDRLALADSMLTMFGIWAMYFSILTAKKLRLDMAMITGFFLGGAWLTKSPAIFFILLLPTTFMFIEKKLNLLKILKLFSLWAVSAALAYGFYNILKLGPNFHMIAIRNKDYVYTVDGILNNPLKSIGHNIEPLLEWILIFLPITVAILALLGIILGFRKYKQEVLFLSLWFLFPTVTQLVFARVFSARYLLFALPPLFILATILVVDILKLKFKHYLIILMLFSLPSIYLSWLIIKTPDLAILPKHERAGFLEAWTSGTGVREVAQYIAQVQVKNPDKSIIVGTEGSFGTLPDGLQIYIEDIPNITVKGIGTVDIAEVDSSLINAKQAQDKVYLVVNKSRLLTNKEHLGLELIAEYKKAQKPDGTTDSLLLLEVTQRTVEIYNIKHGQNIKPR